MCLNVATIAKGYENFKLLLLISIHCFDHGAVTKVPRLAPISGPHLEHQWVSKKKSGKWLQPGVQHHQAHPLAHPLPGGHTGLKVGKLEGCL